MPACIACNRWFGQLWLGYRFAVAGPCRRISGKISSSASRCSWRWNRTCINGCSEPVGLRQRPCFLIWVINEANTGMGDSVDPDDVNRVYDRSAQRPKQSVQYLSSVPCLVPRTLSRCRAMGERMWRWRSWLESSFVADALPPRAYLLWVIPWGRVSPSYGYAQGARPPAWKDFERSMGSSGSRDNFADAIMFIGWYAAGTQQQLGISKWDAYNQSGVSRGQERVQS